MRNLVVLLLLLIVTLVLLFYQFSGVKYFFRANKFVGELKESEKSGALSIYSDITDSYTFKGIYGGLFHNLLFLWGSKGITMYILNPDIEVIYFKACSNGVSAGKVIKLDLLFSEIKSMISSGDFASVLVDQNVTGSYLKHVNRMFIYDYWVFMNTNMEQQCAK